MPQKRTQKGSRVSTATAKKPVSVSARNGVHGNGKAAAGMPDVQGSGDTRNVAIDRVGVKDVTYPIRLKISPCSVEGGGEQTTVAKINMYVSLPHYQKGTHMSRFLEVLNDHRGAICPSDIPVITEAIRERLNAEEAHFQAEFTYFITKPAPVTGSPGLMDYRVRFECTASRTGKTDDFTIAVAAPATSLCPCSKEISAYGAHNQRCVIEAKVRTPPGKMLWIEELARIIEQSASCPVFAVLKRPDEKYVTEAAFDNPKFVEDIIRDLALGLNKEPRIVSYEISSENFESIHNHNAYAQISRDRRRQ
ncbi:MAG TPA: GTP cyclohydrolase FolE2 [Phycisphaerales bacterium]|nr:GTP cyclohydrolase FolE2 [Phycisphaerales bacterium]